MTPTKIALALIARASIDLLTGPDRMRLGVCGAPGCVLFFLKESRRNQWCSATCGNRARVAQHYRRHRQPGPKAVSIAGILVRRSANRPQHPSIQEDAHEHDDEPDQPAPAGDDPVD